MLKPDMPYILAAILSNLSYAFADNANGVVSKRNSPSKVAVWAVIFGLAIFTIPMFIFFQGELAKLNLENIALICGLGLIVALGYFSFVTGMSKGSVMLTGVIGGSFPAVTTVTALLFFGEKVSLLQALAIAVIIIGVVCSSLEGSIRSLLTDVRSSALLYAFGAFFLWGIYFALVRIPVERVGWFLPQYGSNLIALPLYLLIARKNDEKDILKLPRLPGLIALIAVLQVSGSLLFNYAISKGSTAVVAPIAGSSPAVFVIIAYFVFKEKLQFNQKLGVAAALAGIIWLSWLG